MADVRAQAVIREATPDDARAIAAVHDSSWQSTYRGLLNDAYLDSLSVDDHAGRWQRLLASGTGDTFVALEGPDVVGFASCGRERDQDPIYQGELYAIYLLEDRQRRGLGRRLVSSVARRLLELEYRSMLVWVLAANPARAFYEAIGGALVRSRQMELAGETQEEAGYGWLDVADLL